QRASHQSSPSIMGACQRAVARSTPPLCRITRNKHFMKYLGSLLLLLCCGGISNQASQLEGPSYLFRVAGKVIFKKHQVPSGATVYLTWNGPINGRIPWAHANADGTFLIEFTRVAGIYHICAHPGQTRGLLPLARTRQEARKMPIRLSCTDDFALDELQLEKHDLQLKLK